MQLITNSNLLPYQKDAVSKLNSEQQGFVLAKYGHQKVKDILAGDLKMQLHGIVSKMIADCTPKDLEDENLQKLCTEWLYGELKGPHANLTIPEISNAVHRGVRKEYGDWFGYSGVTFNSWLKGYSADQRRLDSIKKFNIQLDAPRTTDKPVNEYRIDVEACKRLFEDYKNAEGYHSKEMALFTAFLHYEVLKEKGLMNYSDQEKREIYDQAKKEYWEKQKRNKIKQERIDLVKLVSDNLNPTIQKDVRRLAVRKYFDYLIKNNLKLEM